MWSTPPNQLQLLPHQIHLWWADLTVTDSEYQQYWVLLSEVEKERSRQFQFEQHQKRFVVARGILRTLLAKYLQKEAHLIQFDYGEKGKPFVKNKIDLYFNSSHSENKGLWGFRLHQPLGVDVEYMDETIEIEEIAQNFFSPNEIQKLKAVPKAHQLTCFYNCWTRKEAFIKAEGKGLAIPLDQFEVSLGIDEMPRMLAIHWNPLEVKDWRLSAFAIRNQYMGAVATKGKLEGITYYQVPLLLVFDKP